MLPATIGKRVDQLVTADELADADMRAGRLLGLEAMTGLRIGLRALELIYVKDLRRVGATWQEIGDALGQPRQAVHRRYANVGEGAE